VAGRFTTLRSRSVTALALGVVMISLIIISPYTILLLFLVVAVFCTWELMTLFNARGNARSLIIALIVGLIAFTVIFLLLLSGMRWIVWLAFFGFFSFVIYVLRAHKLPVSQPGQIAGAIVYVALPLALTGSWIESGNGFDYSLVLGIVILTWTNDVSAYMIGNWVGRRRLSPLLSPNKTWEGTLGGGIITLVASVLLVLSLPILPAWHWISLALMTVICCSIGDLFESYMKRLAAVKDSGTLLPGHGGFLDRFDSFLFTSPFVSVYLMEVVW
jgi:phosphatidate cytidylyltransferase